MNLSKVLKQKRDAEDRLRNRSPQSVFNDTGTTQIFNSQSDYLTKVNLADTMLHQLIKYVDSKYSLPAIGNINYIYITKDEYAMYLWDGINIIYQPLGMSSTELKTLVGGNATTNFEIE